MWSVWRLTGKNDSVMIDLEIYRQALTLVGAFFLNECDMGIILDLIIYTLKIEGERI